VELDDTSAARMELEFILDTERNVVISGKNTARVYLSGESKATFSDEMTVGDFAVNYFGFGNGIKSVKKLLGNVTEITFENNLTEKQKEILLYGDSVNIAPGAFVRVFREIYEGKEPNRSVNKKSYYYVSSLSVTSLPEKLVYDSGADIDLLGMAVTATYGDGTQGPLSYAKFSVNGYDANKTGEQTVELKYLDKTYYLTVETSYDNEGNAPSGAKGGCKGSAGIGLVSGIIVLASSLIFIGRKR
ncbi:MAG: bacterial Ig-like domain-containing protein, partial [Clostridia bacterium]|nr:bacterial Ig-like domain-containing protein [Clostridia bacterium]